ncbi:MAG: hypothetical protein EHM48_07880, partial [Planctomycetaceae bacterium]
MFGRKKNTNDESSSDARSGRAAAGAQSFGRRFVVSMFVMLMTIGILGGAGYLVYFKTNLIQKVQAQIANKPAAPAPTQMRVVLLGVPAWIPASVEQQITASLTPADLKPDDPSLARKV